MDEGKRLVQASDGRDWLWGKVGVTLVCKVMLFSGLGKSPAEGSGNPLQYPCLEIPWTEEPGGLQYIRSHVERD